MGFTETIFSVCKYLQFFRIMETIYLSIVMLIFDKCHCCLAAMISVRYECDLTHLTDTTILLTHWGRVTHICISKLTISGSDNGLSPGRRQAIIWTNAGILLIWTLGTSFSEILNEIHAFSFKKRHLKMLSAKWQPFCLSLNVLSRNTPNRGHSKWSWTFKYISNVFSLTDRDVSQWHWNQTTKKYF